MNSGKLRIAQFDITTSEEVFLKLAEFFGCAKWIITKDSSGLIAQTNSCLLCAMAKKFGIPSPCHLYCLDPMEAMVKSINGGSAFMVEETLWDATQCRIRVK